MIATWYAIVSLMLIIYVVLDGRNFGAGMLHWFVARTPEERRQVIAAIGPLWSWHEVWLVGFGGTLLAVFPRLLASAFAGYYLALFLILWSLILRGISIEVGGHIDDRAVAGILGFRFRVFQFSPGHPFWCCRRQPCAGGAARCRWEFLDGIFHEFQRSRPGGVARLVHGIHCHLRGCPFWLLMARPISR